MADFVDSGSGQKDLVNNHPLDSNIYNKEEDKDDDDGASRGHLSRASFSMAYALSTLRGHHKEQKTSRQDQERANKAKQKEKARAKRKRRRQNQKMAKAKGRAKSTEIVTDLQDHSCESAELHDDSIGEDEEEEEREQKEQSGEIREDSEKDYSKNQLGLTDDHPRGLKRIACDESDTLLVRPPKRKRNRKPKAGKFSNTDGNDDADCKSEQQASDAKEPSKPATRLNTFIPRALMLKKRETFTATNITNGTATGQK